MTEGAAATAVLGVGEEDGEVRRVEGVAKVVAACVGDVRTGRGEDGGARSSGEMRTATTSGRGGVGRCGTARMEEGGGSWPLYRRGEGVGEQRDKLYPESFGRRDRKSVV